MVDEAKLHSPIRSTSKVLVVQRAARRCREELSPLCSPVLDAGAAVHCASHPFAEHTSQMLSIFLILLNIKIMVFPGFRKL